MIMNLLTRLRRFSLFGSARRIRSGPGRRIRCLPLRVERLEDRLVPSNGTTAGTVLVKDINPGPGSAITTPNPLPGGDDPKVMVDLNGTLLFAANDGVHGTELWKSDGTAAGTSLVKDINPGSAGSYPYDFVKVNGTLFFAANDGTHGKELWKSDGTAAGTGMVADINP